MIDGIKTGYLPLDTERLSAVLGVALNRKTVYAGQNGLIFGFSEEVDESTGELRYMCGIRGSVHKYANRGTHNADSFRMSDLCRVFTELREVYSINPDITRLYSVEFGVNIKLPYDPRRVLNAIRMYKGKTFTPMGKIGLIYESQLFNLKIYDKGKQCGVPGFDNVLRIEVKATSSYLKRKGIYAPTLGDLLNTDLWKQFEAVLLEVIGDTMIVEAVQPDALTKKEQALFALFTGDGWQALDKFKLCREKKKFATLIERIGAARLKEDLKDCIALECEYLRDVGEGKCNRINEFSIMGNDTKINDSDNSTDEVNKGFATESTFFQSATKAQKCNRVNIKIKGDSVAHTTPPTVTVDAVRGMPQYTAKLSHTAPIEAKARGKPPDVREYNTG